MNKEIISLNQSYKDLIIQLQAILQDQDHVLIVLCR
jgi:hypothetical protein